MLAVPVYGSLTTTQPPGEPGTAEAGILKHNSAIGSHDARCMLSQVDPKM